MRKYRKFFIGLIMAASLAVGMPMVASSKQALYDCSPNAEPPTTQFANLASFVGYSHESSCYSGYYWTLKVQYWTGSTWANLGILNGGPTYVPRYWDIANPPTVTVNCLAPNGTARYVRDQFYINSQGVGHLSNSGYRLCERQGGTSPATLPPR